MPDKLFADELSRGLGTTLLGKQILSYEESDSTNDAALELAEQGEAEGTCIFAEHQRRGRGRLGRSWLSPKGKSLLFSVILRPLLSPAEVSKITLTAAVSVARCSSRFTGRMLGIKWPNDVVYEEKKICGILTEMRAEADRVNFVVLGIGLNVNAEAEELPPEAGSLMQIAGKEIPRLELGRELLRELERDYLRLREGRFDSIAKDWERFSVTSGRRVAAACLGKKIQGQAMGIDADGALWIRTDSGLQQRILAGDVEHLR